VPNVLNGNVKFSSVVTTTAQEFLNAGFECKKISSMNCTNSAFECYGGLNWETGLNNVTITAMKFSYEGRVFSFKTVVGSPRVGDFSASGLDASWQVGADSAGASIGTNLVDFVKISNYGNQVGQYSCSN
jgi:hypothetical protein